VRAVGLRLAGVDVVTTDIGRPLVETGGVVTEVNGGPGLHHHYLVADRADATPVAVPVLEKLLGEIRYPDVQPNGGPPGPPRTRRFPPHGVVGDVRL
jgi:hypothetical protein